MSGEINHPERFRQPVAFRGLVWGSISPTDIDMAIDFKDRLFVFVEFKEGNKGVERGQLILFERLAERLEKTGTSVLLIIARHHTSHEELVMASEAIVSDWKWKGRWWVQRDWVTVKELIDRCLKHLNLTEKDSEP